MMSEIDRQDSGKNSGDCLNQNPTLTVCVLSYNSEGFIRETLRSIWHASYPCMEVICIDDSSTDGSDVVAKEACQLYGFQYSQNDSNLGIPRTCNIALSQATGEYFTIIGDDIVTKDRYVHDVNLLSKEPDAILISSAVTEFREKNYSLDAESSPAKAKAKLTIESLVSAWLIGSKISTPSVTFRTAHLKSIGGFDEDFRFEDRPLYVELAMRRIPFLVSKSSLTFYRRTKSSLSIELTSDLLRDEIKLFRKIDVSLPKIFLNLRLLLLIYAKMLTSGMPKSRVVLVLRGAGIEGLEAAVSSRLLRVLFVVLHTSFSRAPAQHRHIRQFLSE